ncbi:MAG: OsmC family protein [Ferruginibacter sp.]
MGKEHHYKTTITWTGNRGEGTKTYKGYDRSHNISINNKIDISASSDAPFMGDITKHNPEDMLLASLSSCHMLWFLHLCADSGIVVSNYVDNATGTMVETGKGGHFTEVVLHPQVTITDRALVDKANSLHEEAHKCCFIANSCNFPVTHAPVCNAE